MAEQQQATLVLIRGLPGAGKSTLAQLFGLPVFEADQFFDDRDFDPAELQEAHDWCFDKALQKLVFGKSVVVANTSTTAWEVQRYEELARVTNSRLISIVVENRHGGQSIHDVPKETIHKMRERFELKL